MKDKAKYDRAEGDNLYVFICHQSRLVLNVRSSIMRSVFGGGLFGISGVFSCFLNLHVVTFDRRRRASFSSKGKQCSGDSALPELTTWPFSKLLNPVFTTKILREREFIN